MKLEIERSDAARLGDELRAIVRKHPRIVRELGRALEVVVAVRDIFADAVAESREAARAKSPSATRAEKRIPRGRR